MATSVTFARVFAASIGVTSARRPLARPSPRVVPQRLGPSAQKEEGLWQDPDRACRTGLNYASHRPVSGLRAASLGFTSS